MKVNSNYQLLFTSSDDGVACRYTSKGVIAPDKSDRLTAIIKVVPREALRSRP